MELGVLVTRELRRLGPAFEPRLLEDRRHLRVRQEVPVALLVPVEEHPDPAVVVWIAKDLRTLRAVLLSLLSALGRERVPEALEVLDPHRGQDHAASSFGVVKRRAVERYLECLPGTTALRAS